jgi:hypothetical protein
MIGRPDLPTGEFLLEEHDFSPELTAACPDWQNTIVKFVRTFAAPVAVNPEVTGSCEDPTALSTQTIYTVPTPRIQEHLPWLIEVYKTEILSLGRAAVGSELIAAKKPNNRMNINLQPSGGGYDGHVDFNGLSALLYFTGGSELRIARSTDACRVATINENYVSVQPEPGKLTIFNGRYPHYVTAPNPGQAYRVAAAMNFYTPDYPESMRPQDVANYSEGLV